MRLSFKLLRRDDGVASFVALGIVLVTGLLLIGYGLWVRFAVESSRVFEDRLHAHHGVREGVGMAIGLLLEDDNPDVDWLGERWAQGIDGNEQVEQGHRIADESVTVYIRDEGSLLGLNWMERPLWMELPGMTAEAVEEIVSGRQRSALGAGLRGGGQSGGLGLLGTAKQLDVLGLDEEDITAIHEMTTSFGPFNVNAAEPDVLQALFVALGESPTRARAIVDQLVDARTEEPIGSFEQLQTIASGLRSEVGERARPWLVFSGPINVNTAPPDVLTHLFRAYDYSEDAVHAIVEVRDGEPLRSLSDIEELLNESLVMDDGRLTPLAGRLGFQSHFFRIVSEAKTRPTRITAIVHRSRDEETSRWKVQIISWNEEAGP